MSNRRMFSTKIIDSDAFMDMPASTQGLYFHLCMRADDEGFVGNPKKIMRMVGSAEDDLKVLLLKRFVLAFESGIVVIKHWLIHNTIRMDRFSPTSYQEEKKLLAIKKNNSYTEKNNENKDILEIQERTKPKWQIRRDNAYKDSELPDSFSYKIRNAFREKPCPICGIKMQDFEYSENKRPTIQHNKPISLGGKHEIGNISVICRECNVSIQDRETTSELNNKEVIEIWHTLGTHSATQVKLSKDKIEKKEASINFLKEIPNDVITELTFKFKCDEPQIKTKANSLFDYCESKGRKYRNYKALLSNALRKDFGERPPKEKVPIWDKSGPTAKIIGYK